MTIMLMIFITAARPCRNFLSGKCPYGDACSYIHIRPETLVPSARQLSPQSSHLQGGPSIFPPAYVANIYPSPSSDSGRSPIIAKSPAFAPLPQLIIPPPIQSGYSLAQSPVAYVSPTVPPLPIYATPLISDHQVLQPPSHPARSVSAQKSIYYRSTLLLLTRRVM